MKPFTHLIKSPLKLLHTKWFARSRSWYPILSVFYLANECDFRCPYCSDGSGTPYYRLSPKTVSGPLAMKILKQIRRHCDYVVITGGEPLKHHAFDYVAHHLGEAGFANTTLTTNGYEIQKHLAGITKSFHTVVFSLDTLDHRKADNWYGLGGGTLDRILRNINKTATHPQRNYEIVISSVVTPDNIHDLYEVYEYASKYGFTFAASPQLMGVHPHGELKGNPDYTALFNFLIKNKKKGGRIFGSSLYLRYMRDLSNFRCHPFTMLVVSPLGDVYYPCLEMGQYAGNLLHESNLHQLRRKGAERFGPPPDCGNQCHSACALSFALGVRYPLSLFG